MKLLILFGLCSLILLNGCVSRFDYTTKTLSSGESTCYNECSSYKETGECFYSEPKLINNMCLCKLENCKHILIPREPYFNVSEVEER